MKEYKKTKRTHFTIYNSQNEPIFPIFSQISRITIQHLTFTIQHFAAPRRQNEPKYEKSKLQHRFSLNTAGFSPIAKVGGRRCFVSDNLCN
jgi:hypothetical protein